MSAHSKDGSDKASTLPGRKNYGDWRQESGQWLGLLRDQWFPRNPYKFHWTVRFFFLFLGALFYMTAFNFLAFFPSISLLSGVLTVDMLFLSTLAPSALFGMFFAGLLCWIDREAGPARLFLSGFAFPAFVVLVFRYSLGKEILLAALRIPPEVAGQ